MLRPPIFSTPFLSRHSPCACCPDLVQTLAAAPEGRRGPHGHAGAGGVRGATQAKGVRRSLAVSGGGRSTGCACTHQISFGRLFREGWPRGESACLLKNDESFLSRRRTTISPSLTATPSVPPTPPLARFPTLCRFNAAPESMPCAQRAHVDGVQREQGWRVRKPQRRSAAGEPLARGFLLLEPGVRHGLRV